MPPKGGFGAFEIFCCLARIGISHTTLIASSEADCSAITTQTASGLRQHHTTHDNAVALKRFSNCFLMLHDLLEKHLFLAAEN